MLLDTINNLIDTYVPPDSIEEQWDIGLLEKQLKNDFSFDIDLAEKLNKDETLNELSLRELIVNHIKDQYAKKRNAIGNEVMAQFEKSVLLQTLDSSWREHLASMDHLRQGIHLRGYAQKDPKQEYKREAFTLFSEMLDSLKYEVISILVRVQIASEEEVIQAEEQRKIQLAQDKHYQHDDVAAIANESDHSVEKVEPFKRVEPKIGRNELCPCDSGKKYKHCHGKIS